MQKSRPEALRENPNQKETSDFDWVKGQQSYNPYDEPALDQEELDRIQRLVSDTNEISNQIQAEVVRQHEQLEKVE